MAFFISDIAGFSEAVIIISSKFSIDGSSLIVKNVVFESIPMVEDL